MGLIELILLAIGLAMDAFAVSICKGLAAGRVTPKEYFLCGIWFGSFQAVMPGGMLAFLQSPLPSVFLHGFLRGGPFLS